MVPIVILSNILITLAHSVLFYYIVGRIASIPRRTLYLCCSSIPHTLLWVINYYLLPENTPFMDLIGILLSIATVVFFAQKGRRWKAAISIMITLPLQIILNYFLGLIAFPIAQKLGYPPNELMNFTTSFGRVIMSSIMLFLLFPLYLLAERLIALIFDSKGQLSSILYFLPILISQGLLMNITTRVLPAVHNQEGIIAYYTLSVLFSIAADVVFLIGIQKVRQASLLQEQVRFVNQQLDVQIGYYRQLQDNIRTVNQIRHDLTNQLQAAYHLLETGETTPVRRQLDHLQDQLRHKIGPQFSGNLMVDAVLQSKEAHCREKEISLAINTEIPAQLSVESAHLCSVFSNLLDNSIHGVLENDAGEKTISLQAAVRKNCLIIHCANPARKPLRQLSQDPLRVHGLGLEILKKISSEYDGYLNTEYQDGWFYATVCLPLSEEAEGVQTYAR